MERDLSNKVRIGLHVIMFGLVCAAIYNVHDVITIIATVIIVGMFLASLYIDRKTEWRRRHGK
jgi:hypothetical protein